MLYNLYAIMSTMIIRDGNKAHDEVLWQTEDGVPIIKVINATQMHPYKVGEFVKFQETLFEIKDIAWEMIDDNSVCRTVTVKIHGSV